MFDLKPVVFYIVQRVGLMRDRVWFGAGSAINAKLTATERRNFLRFLNRHGRRRYLVLDDLHKKQPVDLGRLLGNARSTPLGFRLLLVPLAKRHDQE
jgi:hypothetical protein